MRRRSKRNRVYKSRRRVGGRKRKAGSFATFTKRMWSKNRAHFKRIGIGSAAKIISKKWKASH